MCIRDSRSAARHDAAVGMTDQADALGDHVDAHGDLAGNGLVAGLDVVALVGDVADDADAAVADELGGTAGGKNCAQVVGGAVVLLSLIHI